MTARPGAAALAFVAVLLAAMPLFMGPARTQAVDLPRTVAPPVENPRPDPEADEKQALPDAPGEAPLPSESPAQDEEPPSGAAGDEKMREPPRSAPVPGPRPEDAPKTGRENERQEPAADPAEAPGADPARRPETKPEEAEPLPKDPRSTMPVPAEPPAEELACRKRLETLGVAFETRPGERNEAGCAMPWPVSVSTLGKGIAIEPAALVNCATAEAAARFAQEVVAEEARSAFSTGLRTVRQVSGYVCRPRAGTKKLSEHAFGNAIDFGGFVLEDGREIVVARSEDLSTSRFLARLRTAACGPFKTVLGPGSDEDHADHIHLDLAPRRNGSEFCQW